AMRGVDVAHAAGKSDRLVITAPDFVPILAAHFGFETAEIAAQVGPAELVVERGGADRCLEHDLERGGDALRLAGGGAFPELLVSRDAQVGHGIADQSRLRLRAAPGGALVADL